MESATAMAEPTEDLKKCPECGQMIRKDATFCRHCGVSFEPRNSPAAPPSDVPVSKPGKEKTVAGAGQPRTKQPLLLMLFIALCVCIISVFAVRMVMSRGDPGKRSDAEFEAQMRHSLMTAGWKSEVTAEDGVCTIRYEDEVPKETAEAVAR